MKPYLERSYIRWKEKNNIWVPLEKKNIGEGGALPHKLQIHDKADAHEPNEKNREMELTKTLYGKKF